MSMHKRPWYTIALGLGLAILSGCGGEGSAGSGQTQGDDLAQWNMLVAQYDARRTSFLGTHVQDLAAAGNQLFWYDSTNFDFRLVGYNDTTQAKINYTFSIGAGDNHNYRASPNMILTAEPGGDPVVYHAYDPASPNTEIATTTVKKPPGAQWAAYAASGNTAYMVDTSTAGATTLLKWTPGQDPSPVVVTTLESAGASISEFWDFDVSGNTMVFIESGRIWKMDIAANKATWLMNKTEVSGAVDFRDDGVMFASASGLMFYDYNKSALVNVTELINANPYMVNVTFRSASKIYQEDFSRWNKQVLYIGNSGLFAYDLVNDKITPIVLSPNSSTLRVDYRYPVALDNGTAFVTGLTSMSGAVGADGPTFKIDLNPILK
jgi:hypothetical protein